MAKEKGRPPTPNLGTPCTPKKIMVYFAFKCLRCIFIIINMFMHLRSVLEKFTQFFLLFLKDCVPKRFGKFTHSTGVTKHTGIKDVKKSGPIPFILDEPFQKSLMIYSDERLKLASWRCPLHLLDAQASSLDKPACLGFCFCQRQPK